MDRKKQGKNRGRKSGKKNHRNRNRNGGAEISGTDGIFMQSVRRGDDGGRRRGGRSREELQYDEYLAKEVWTEKVKNGELFVGSIRISSKSFNCAFVRPKGFKRDVFVYGMKARNRTLNGDVVVISLLPEEKWNKIETDDAAVSVASNAMGAISLSGGAGGGDLWDCQFKIPSSAPGNKDGDDNPTTTKANDLHPAVVAINKRASERNLQPAGVVVAVEEFGQTWTKEHMGRIEIRKKTDAFAKFRPHDKRVPWMIVPALHIPDQLRDDPDGDAAKEIYLTKMDFTWKTTSQQPSVEGGTVRSLGESGCIGPETRALLITNGVDHGEFPEDVLEDLKQYMPSSSDDAATKTATKSGNALDLGTHATETTWKIPEEEIRKRRDLRKHRIFSIDPWSAKDLDDALHITKISKDVYEIGVHIADVSYFVRPRTALDREAAVRCTSVYLVQRVIPMLPPLLCEKLCSLNPSVDRLAFSCIWRMHGDGTMVTGHRPWYGRTVIRSCCKLDYGTAQRMIEGVISPEQKGSDISTEDWALDRRPTDGHTIEQVVSDVVSLAKVALGRRKKRFENGSIRLDKVKLSFVIDPKSGNPSGMKAYPIRQSNNLVEEYMLLANFLVAQRLLQAYGADGPALVRNHPPPASKPLEVVREACARNGIHLNTGSAKSLQQSLKALLARVGRKGIVYDTVISLLTHPMKQAQYICAGGSDSPRGWRHYALAIPYYTHFTSPIRRYADVLVHRLLFAALEQPDGQSVDDNIRASGYDVDTISEACGRCNEKKENAAAASLRSDEVYLCVYIKEIGRPLEVDGSVIGVGEKSFTLLIPSLSLEKRLLAQEAFPNFKSVEHDEETETLTVTYRDVDAGGKEHERKKTLSVLTPLRLIVDAKLSPPPCDVTVRLKLNEKLPPAVSASSKLGSK